jgi:hypothetical protein
MFEKSPLSCSIRPQNGRSIPSAAEGHQFALAGAEDCRNQLYLAIDLPDIYTRFESEFVVKAKWRE